MLLNDLIVKLIWGFGLETGGVIGGFKCGLCYSGGGSIIGVVGSITEERKIAGGGE